MGKNLFKGFKLFTEDEENNIPNQYVSTVKKQLQIPKKTWLGMPITITNTKIGNQMITDPTLFYVTDFDDYSVTITNVPKFGNNDEEDIDDEIDIDDETIKDNIEITISREDFYNLQNPQISPNTDANSISGGLI